MCRNKAISTSISAFCLFNFLCYRIAAAKCNGDFIFADSIYLRKDSAKKIVVKFRQWLEVFQEFPCRFFTEKVSAVVVLLLSQFFKLTGIFAFQTIEFFQFVTHMTVTSDTLCLPCDSCISIHRFFYPAPTMSSSYKSRRSKDISADG